MRCADDPFAGRNERPFPRDAREDRILDIFGGLVTSIHPADLEYLYDSFDTILFAKDKLEYENKRLKTLINQEAIL